MNSNHYFSPNQSSKIELSKIETILTGKKISLFTITGVFSKKRIDNGTRVLVENMKIPKKGNFLDLGCGIGVIGIIAAINNPKLNVHLSDVNHRAVKVARLNVELLGLNNCRVYEGSLYEPFGELLFNSIVSNPPVSAGMHKVVYLMIDGAYNRLVDGGLLQMVIQTNKGGKMLADFFDDFFGTHEVSAIKSGYRVLTGIK